MSLKKYGISIFAYNEDTLLLLQLKLSLPFLPFLLFLLFLLSNWIILQKKGMLNPSSFVYNYSFGLEQRT